MRNYTKITVWTCIIKEAFSTGVQCKIIILFKFALKKNWKYIIIFLIKSSFEIYSECHLF
jgi:hypothetical protein